MFLYRGIRRYCYLLIICGWPLSSSASLFMFTDQLAFQNALVGSSQQTTHFDSVLAPQQITNQSVFDAIDFSFSDSGGTSFDGQIANEFLTTSGENYLAPAGAAGFISGDSISLQFSSVIHAIGLFVIGSPGDLGFSDDLILYTNRGSVSNASSPATTLNDGGDVFFLGLIDTEGFSLASLTTACCGFFEFTIDDIQIARFNPAEAVPEPLSILLLLPSLLLLIFQRRVSANPMFKSRI